MSVITPDMTSLSLIQVSYLQANLKELVNHWIPFLCLNS